MVPMCCAYNCPHPTHLTNTDKWSPSQHFKFPSSAHRPRVFFSWKTNTNTFYSHLAQQTDQPMCYVSSILHKSKEYFEIFASSSLRVHALWVWLCNIVGILQYGNLNMRVRCLCVRKLLDARFFQHHEKKRKKEMQMGEQCKHMYMNGCFNLIRMLDEPHVYLHTHSV